MIITYFINNDFISIMVPSILIGEANKEEETAIDKVKLLTIGTRFVATKLNLVGLT